MQACDKSVDKGCDGRVQEQDGEVQHQDQDREGEKQGEDEDASKRGLCQ